MGWLFFFAFIINKIFYYVIMSNFAGKWERINRNTMRKISFISLAALFAVSCNQDVQLAEFAGTEQSNEANSAQQISDFITKNVVELYDGNFIEVSNIYAQFARELAERDSRVVINSLSGVPSIEDHWLTLDFSKIGGEFIATPHGNTWDYTPDEGFLKFVYPYYNFRNRMFQKCELVARAKDENCEFSPFPLFTLQFPQTITDSLYVNGELAAEGAILSGSVGSSSFLITSNRHIANYSVNCAFDATKLNDSALGAFGAFEAFEIERNGKNLIQLLTTQTTGGSRSITFAFGDTEDECIYISTSDDNIYELISLLSINKKLINGERINNIAAIKDRINSFNENSPLKFEYDGINTTVAGEVRLVLLKPNLARKTACMGLELAFKVNDGTEIVLSEPAAKAAIEEAIETTIDIIIACKQEVEHAIYCYVSAVIKRLEEIRDGIIEFNKAVIEGINDYNQTVINNIISYNQMAYKRVQEFERWAAATLSLQYEFFKGLGEYQIAFVNGIVSQIGTFISNLDEFLEDFYNRN